jgi:formamidopyrimidine-DNA glycosylase
MPELPEVETYIRELAPHLHGRRVVDARVTWPRTIAIPSADEFATQIVGRRFERFGRRAKYLLFTLDDGRSLIVHLRMTGKLQVVDSQPAPDPHTHVVLRLDDGRELRFRDARKFGRIWLVADVDAVLHGLGPEPLDDAFTEAGLGAQLARRKAPIKPVLLDQGVAAGIGNIYADEALYRAGVHPARPANSLTGAEVARLHAAIRAVLGDAIRMQGSSLGGSSVQNYVRPDGEPGGFQAEHRVFQRTGQPCFTCGQAIERIVLGQRSTHFCPHCQPRG